MAEADSDDDLETTLGAQSKSPNNEISILMLASNWQVDAYGIASLTRSLVNDLCLLDPVGHKIHITCAVLEEDGKISQADLDDAKKHNVQLRGAKIPRGSSTSPNIKWLDEDVTKYYHHVVSETAFDFIFGHTPYTANGALNLQDLCRGIGQTPKVILIGHTLPKTQHGNLDRSSISCWLKEAHAILSIGHGVEAEMLPLIDDLDEAPIHKLYIPQCPVELLAVKQPIRGLKGKQVITVMTVEEKDLLVNGLDHQLVLTAAIRAADNILGQEAFDYKKQIRMELLVLTPNQNERDLWARSFNEIKENQPTKYQGLTFEFQSVNNTDELKTFMRQTSVLLLPLIPGSPLFGTEALSAAAAGTSILVSSNSGMASLLHHLDEVKSVIHNKGALNADAQLWNVRITEKLTKPKDAQQEAENIRAKLIQDTTIASSHLDFIRIITGKHIKKYVSTSVRTMDLVDLEMIFYFKSSFPWKFYVEQTVHIITYFAQKIQHLLTSYFSVLNPFLLLFIIANTTTQLSIDLGPNPAVSKKATDTATRLGVYLGKGDELEVNTFIIAFLTKLLHQREKLDLGLLDARLPTAVKTAWQELIAHLEIKNRKLVGFQSGSVTLNLFCPLPESYNQLSDKVWKETASQKMLNLLSSIGKLKR